MIKKAFAKLLHEKDISKISVTNIVETAEISRGTFYAHYRDVYSLFDQIENEELDKLLSLIDEIGYETILSSPKAFLNETLKYLNRDMEYYKMLFLSHNASRFMLRIKESLETKILSDNNSSICASKRPYAAVYISFFASGLSLTITDWMKGSLSISLDDLSDILSEIMRKAFNFESKDLAGFEIVR
ncbi:MAG: TetR/AcrR family transcriptional regulator [Oscillospiraceae bacterium]|jgi:AcrR family transcriptional regulator|nr:TetR/AcrR family transcriptional regulator [Oscillospiraceae bacterium]